MSAVTTRADFEKLVDLRLEEAKNLIDRGNWDGAYYLAGYAVEFALKVRIIFALKVRIIARLMGSNVFPDPDLHRAFYSHNLAKLLEAADLKGAMASAPAASSSWILVVTWSEQSRYETGKTEQQAKKLYGAIANEVVPWIKARW